MLGYLDADKWVDGIQRAKEKDSHMDERILWELLKEQDDAWGFPISEEVKEKLKEKLEEIKKKLKAKGEKKI